MKVLSIANLVLLYLASIGFEYVDGSELTSENATYWRNSGSIAIGSFNQQYYREANPNRTHIYFPLYRKEFKVGDKFYVHLDSTKIIEAKLSDIRIDYAPCSDQDIYYIGVLKLGDAATSVNDPKRSIFVLVSDIKPPSDYRPASIGVVGKFKIDPDLKTHIDRLESRYLMDSFLEQKDVKDAVAIRRDYFPFKEIDQRILNESDAILTKRSAIKAYRLSSSWVAVLVNSEWKYDNRVVALMSTEHLIADGILRHSAKTQDFIKWMRMPEFSRRTWKLERLKFYEGIFDADFDSIAEVLTDVRGFESCGWELRKFNEGRLDGTIVRYFHGH